MKKLFVLLTGLFITLITAFYIGTTQILAENTSDHTKGEIIVKFVDNASSQEKAELHRNAGGKVKSSITSLGVQLVDVGKKDLGKVISEYARSNKVEFVEPNFIAQALVDDADFSRQWGLNNTGQKTCNTEESLCILGKTDADVDAPEAWEVTTGDPGVAIAILDTGIDQNHPDLVGKIAKNANFTASNTEDDRYGHGTHVAGIAAAQTNNSIGVAGIGYNSKLYNVKVLDDNGYGSYYNIAQGIMWAADEGAKVINMSLGGGRRSTTLENAVNYAWNRGVVVVAAAGNSNNSSRTYPAYYTNCIAVAATDNNDVKTSISSYGDWVDIAAPGENIYSTFPNHPFVIEDLYKRSRNYDFGSGTSMATPFVSGIAGLVWSLDGVNSNVEVRNIIESTADYIEGTGTYWMNGRVNACSAVGGNNCERIEPPVTPPEDPPVDPPSGDACSNYCFKSVCDGICHPKKEGSNCPDCW